MHSVELFRRSMSAYNAMHWKIHFVLSAFKFKNILGYVLRQSSIHLNTECSSPGAWRHLPTHLTLSTTVISLTVWAGAVRCHWATAEDSLALVPAHMRLISTSRMRKGHRLTDKGRMLSWQMWPCLMELVFPSTIWEYRKTARFVWSPGWHLSCSVWSSDL